MEQLTITKEKEYEIRSTDTVCTNESELQHKLWHNLKYTAVGIVFGIVFVKAEIISWFRIQEMFHFQSFHMYGILSTAVLTATISVWLIKKLKPKTIYGEVIHIEPKKFNKGYIIGGLLFGVGWAITGACPGPLYGQIGAGFTIVIITYISAVFGTWVYGLLRDKLPH